MAKTDSSLLRAYYQLTKPGIIYGNLLTAAAGFLLAARWHINIGLLIATLVGTSLVIASACVCNNYIDRGIDRVMARTKKRALAKGTIAGKAALTYAFVLGLAGFTILVLFTNMLVVAIGVIAFVDYVILYGFAKRHFVSGTIVGSISGSAPIVAGYCAVTGHFDTAALLLFLALTFWQMPHFYAIAMYRYQDYKAAGIPVLPVRKGMRNTKLYVLTYILGFIITAALLTPFGYTGIAYLVMTILFGLLWLGKGLRSYRTTDDAAWGRGMFGYSLLVILGFSTLLAIGAMLP